MSVEDEQYPLCLRCGERHDEAVVGGLIIGVDWAQPMSEASVFVQLLSAFLIEEAQNRWYILVEKEVQSVDNLYEWVTWMGENEQTRIIAQTQIDEAVGVSTVFMGLNFDGTAEEPLVFETMVFHHGARQWRQLHSSYNEALQRHETIVGALKMESDLNVVCADCGATQLEIFYTGKAWGEVLCESCYEVRVQRGEAREGV